MDSNSIYDNSNDVKGFEENEMCLLHETVKENEEKNDFNWNMTPEKYLEGEIKEYS